MEKYKYQVLALFLAILLGFFGGNLVSSYRGSKQLDQLRQRQVKQIESLLQATDEAIAEKNKEVEALRKLALEKDRQVRVLTQQLQAMRAVQTQLQAELKKAVDQMSPNEKAAWLIDRYR
jgi:transposase